MTLLPGQLNGLREGKRCKHPSAVQGQTLEAVANVRHFVALQRVIFLQNVNPDAI